MKNALTKIISAVFLVTITTFAEPASATQTRVRQYECQTIQGQNQPRPQNAPIKLDVPNSLSGKLAVYASSFGPFFSVAAPDGWQCSVAVPILGGEGSLGVSSPKASGSVGENEFDTAGNLDNAINFYMITVPLFPKIFPGKKSHWIASLLGPGHSDEEALLDKSTLLGRHDRIIPVNDHMVVVVTPAHMGGFSAPTSSGGIGALSYPAYSVVGMNNPGKGQMDIVYILRIAMPPSADYSVNALLRLNEQQVEAALAKVSLSK